MQKSKLDYIRAVSHHNMSAEFFLIVQHCCYFVVFNKWCTNLFVIARHLNTTSKNTPYLSCVLTFILGQQSAGVQKKKKHKKTQQQTTKIICKFKTTFTTTLFAPSVRFVLNSARDCSEYLIAVVL